MGKVFLISEDVLSSILSYLAQRPWKEVNEGMVALTSLKEYTVDNK